MFLDKFQVNELSGASGEWLVTLYIIRYSQKRVICDAMVDNPSETPEYLISIRNVILSILSLSRVEFTHLRPQLVCP